MTHASHCTTKARATHNMSEARLKPYMCAYMQDEWQMSIIGTEVKVPHGRIDILAWQETPGSFDTINIVEIKAVPLQMKDVAQVLKYTYDIRKLYNLLGLEWVGDALTGNAIRPHLIGTDAPEDVLAASAGADIEVALWAFDKATGFCLLPPVGSPKHDNVDDVCGDLMARIEALTEQEREREIIDVLSSAFDREVVILKEQG